MKLKLSRALTFGFFIALTGIVSAQTPAADSPPGGKIKVIRRKQSIATLFALGVVLLLQFSAFAQANAPAIGSTIHTNTAIVPVARTDDYAIPRQNFVLQFAKEHPGNYDIEFIGDSITQGWVGAGKNVWQEFYGRARSSTLASTATAPNTSSGVSNRDSSTASRPKSPSC